MKKVTSVTGWNDSVGKRLSITFSEIDETTGKIITDNKRTDIVITEKAAEELIDGLLRFAQDIVES